MIYSIVPTPKGYHIVNYRGIVLYEIYSGGAIVSSRNGKYSRILTNGRAIIIRVREPDETPHTLGILYRDQSFHSDYFTLPSSDSLSLGNRRSPRHFNPLTDYTYDNEMVEIDIGEKVVFCNNITLKVREIWTFHGLIVNDEINQTSCYFYLDGRPPLINIPGYCHVEHFQICPT